MSEERRRAWLRLTTKQYTALGALGVDRQRKQGRGCTGNGERGGDLMVDVCLTFAFISINPSVQRLERRASCVSVSETRILRVVPNC